MKSSKKQATESRTTRHYQWTQIRDLEVGGFILHVIQENLNFGKGVQTFGPHVNSTQKSRAKKVFDLAISVEKFKSVGEAERNETLKLLKAPMPNSRLSPEFIPWLTSVKQSAAKMAGWVKEYVIRETVRLEAAGKKSEKQVRKDLEKFTVGITGSKIEKIELAEKNRSSVGQKRKDPPS